MTGKSVDEYTSPLDANQAETLNTLIQSLSANQLTWISGYLAGINADSAAGAVATPQAAAAPVAASATDESLTVLYGSQTGNAEDVAEQFVERAQAEGLNATAQDMLDYKPKNLKSEKNIVVLASTHGEGEPPDNAEELHELIFSKKAPKLDGVRYSVLAFGDTSYDNFCQTGKDFDRQLEALGAERVAERVDLDVDFDDPAETWIGNVVETFKEQLGGATAAADAHPTVTPMHSANTQSGGDTYSRKNPYTTEVLTNVTLNGRGSPREVRHIELDTEDSGLVWEPGDSLGILPENDPDVVAELIEILGLSPADEVTGTDGETTLEDALTRDYEITTLTRPFVEAYAHHADSDELSAMLGEDRREELSAYMAGRYIVDLVRDYPITGVTAAEFVRLLRKLPPRLYSIASSYTANPDEVHLTVDALRYEAHGRTRYGVASVQLADRSDDAKLPVYIDHNKNFKLPADDVPIIMIGPGTGIAPFRAFLEEREEREATGANWLFFGAPHFRTDFYYQTDWLRWRREGLLTRMDVAFSRDQSDKVYVQHKLLAAAAEIYDWIEHGAVVYVCGDAEAMAHDVHNALIRIIGDNAGLSEDDAAARLKQLQKDKRYQRDVY
ncbi:assimilatory sulfite reductase (NADPH) flavoprotein subunit [Salinisphaera sp. USBA-960]|uniref:assimilatory sulfite reductase (NADPH) flavoprotein subunit n=1 Tax=Salinisphaera orenii TaxID=856731 RepID=UPI000DBE54CA|nr:assimilatory sulfite reductase (NADPH) flavoprotein subunit [Salifodinibacter halophilus]NNC26802.1 assimilatory sulfite reductase (NADPH) flavoprotein subunit [Salifodinibacter halophilus]